MLGLWSSKKTGRQSQEQLINGAARFHQMRDTRGPRSGGPVTFPRRLLATRSAGRCTWLAAAAGDVRRPRHCRIRTSAGWGIPQRRFHMLGGSCPPPPAYLPAAEHPASACWLLPQIAVSRAGHCCELNSMESLISILETRLGIVTCNQHLGSRPPDRSDSGDGVAIATASPEAVSK